MHLRSLLGAVALASIATGAATAATMAAPAKPVPTMAAPAMTAPTAAAPITNPFAGLSGPWGYTPVSCSPAVVAGVINLSPIQPSGSFTGTLTAGGKMATLTGKASTGPTPLSTLPNAPTMKAPPTGGVNVTMTQNLNGVNFYWAGVAMVSGPYAGTWGSTIDGVCAIAAKHM